MAAEKYKAKKAKIAVIKKKNIADLNSWKASIQTIKAEYTYLGSQLKSNRGSFNNHVRYDQIEVEKLEAVLTELMFLEKDLNKAIKAKDKQAAKEFTKQMKPLIKKEARHSKDFNNYHLWSTEEARAAKDFIKWIKTPPSKNKPKGL